MIALLRLAVVGFIVMTLFYILIRIYSRSLRREKLEKRWDSEGMTGDRDAWIRDGLADYDNSIRPKLILLVYVVPTAVVGVILYLVNAE